MFWGLAASLQENIKRTDNSALYIQHLNAWKANVMVSKSTVRFFGAKEMTLKKVLNFYQYDLFIHTYNSIYNYVDCEWCGIRGQYNIIG